MFGSFTFVDQDGSCNLTTHWDPRSGAILGWYVELTEGCPWPDWTYSSAFSNDTGDYMSGPQGEFLLAVEMQLFYEYELFFSQVTNEFEFEDSDEYYYTPEDFEFFPEERQGTVDTSEAQSYYYTFDLRYYDYYDFSYYSSSQW